MGSVWLMACRCKPSRFLRHSAHSPPAIVCWPQAHLRCRTDPFRRSSSRLAAGPAAFLSGHLRWSIPALTGVNVGVGVAGVFALVCKCVLIALILHIPPRQSAGPGGLDCCRRLNAVPGGWVGHLATDSTIFFATRHAGCRRICSVTQKSAQSTVIVWFWPAVAGYSSCHSTSTSIDI